MNLTELRKTLAAGESETVEFKKSTGQLTRAGETLCAFLNGRDGQVFILPIRGRFEPNCLERIVAEAREFRGETPQGDDQAVVVLKVDERGSA